MASFPALIARFNKRVSDPNWDCTEWLRGRLLSMEVVTGPLNEGLAYHVQDIFQSNELGLGV